MKAATAVLVIRPCARRDSAAGKQVRGTWPMNAKDVRKITARKRAKEGGVRLAIRVIVKGGPPTAVCYARPRNKCCKHRT